MLLRLVLDENTDQVVHTLVLVLLTVFVHIELLAQETVPILLKLGLGGLTDHLTLNLDGMFVILVEETFYTTST